MTAGPLPSAVTGAIPLDVRRYRPDIDGLRALSILLVVAFHARVPGFEGGFVGVDVFFVISGYLITGLLVAEYERSGSVDLRRFFIRRVKRLLPLASTVTVATMAVGYLLVAPLDRVRLVWDGIASTLYVANWRYATQATAYSEIEVTESLLLHYWSLSIEEQFYLVWPFLLLFVGWVSRRRSWRFRRVLFGALTVIIGGSLTSSLVLTSQLGPAAYYVTHTRLWELALGALLAVVAPRLRALPVPVAEVGALAGMAAIVLAAIGYDASTPFPGGAAALPAIGAVAVIASAISGSTRVARFLGAGSLPRLGLWSYAWYLWHWPLIGLALLARERFDLQMGRPLLTAVAVVGSLGLAALTHVTIEEPFRRSRRTTQVGRHTLVGVTLVAAPLLLATGILVFGNTGGTAIETAGAVEPRQGSGEVVQPVPEDSDDETRSGTAPVARPQAGPMSPQEAMDDRVSLGNPRCNAGGHTNTEAPEDCVFGDPSGATTIALIGDSHAQHWLPALDAVARARGWRLLSWTKGACAPFDLTIYDYRRERPYDGCNEWRDNVMTRLAAEDELSAVVIGRSYGYQGLVLDEHDGIVTDEADLAARWTVAVDRTLERLDGQTERVIILHDTPWAEGSIPRCLSLAEDPLECALDLGEAAGRDGLLLRAEAAAGRGAPRLDFIDMDEHICPEDPCPMVLPNGVIKYRDNSHLSQTYSRWLAPEISAALDHVLRQEHLTER